MFTGIIEELGEVLEIQDTTSFRTIRVGGRAIFDDLRIGSSIAVNGVCLTARSISSEVFSAEMSKETLDRTSLGSLKKGAVVNLERPMRADSRFGGHIVQGHVDGVGTVERVAEQGDAVLLDILVPPDVDEATVAHGSIAVDGVSLTVNARPAQGVIQVSLIPFTRAQTTLGALRPGDRVHVEGDVLGKYVRQLWHSDR